MKIKTESNDDIKNSLESLTKVAEKLIDKNKNFNEKENQAPSDENSTFINYICSQLGMLPKKKRLELQAKMSVLVNNAILEEVMKEDE